MTGDPPNTPPAGLPDRTKGVLMLACALVILGNLLIWTV